MNDEIPMVAFPPLRNGSDLHFDDISSELWRVYEWADGFKVRIELPLCLNVSDSGGHRLLAGNGECHYIPSGWRHLTWLVKSDAPHFVR